MMFKGFWFVAGTSSFGRILPLILGLVLFPNQAVAQSATYLRGVVEDPSRAPVPGAKLILISKATGENRTAISDSNGRLLFEKVVPEAYKLNEKAEEIR